MRRGSLLPGIILALGLATACSSGNDDANDGGSCKATNEQIAAECNECLRSACCSELVACVQGTECNDCAPSRSNASNVILRNFKMVGNNCSDSPSDCSGGADAITIGDGSHHVWVDHLDGSDGSDGNLDITGGADFVTVSWTKFSYSTKRTDPDAGASGHRFSNLIGSSDTDARDPDKLNVTYHHCWWAQNVDQRMPRSRRGQIHVFNNLYTATGNSYCTNAGQDAKLLVQNNVYAGVNYPLQVSQNGTLKAEGNDFTNSTGNKTGSGNGFTPTYDYELDATSGLQAAIQDGAGPKQPRNAEGPLQRRAEAVLSSTERARDYLVSDTSST